MYFIEIFQAFTGRLPEVDDLIANTAGFLVGYLTAQGFLELFDKKAYKYGIIRILSTVILFCISIFALSFCGKAKMNHIYSNRDIETAWSFRLSHFFCAIFYFSYLCSIPYCSIIFTYASSSACNASPFAQKDRANIKIKMEEIAYIAILFVQMMNCSNY